MAKELKFVLLLDCYGELLTERQRNVTELYYCEDLSLSEISEPLGITRQSVRDLIKRSEQLLLHYEEKLGFAERLGKMRDCFRNIEAVASGIQDRDIRDSIITEINKGSALL